MEELKQHTDSPQFLDAFKGKFSGILRWEQLTTFWDVLRRENDGGWYIYAVGEAPPKKTATTSELNNFITEIDNLLRRDHDEDYCGIVYADNRETPSFIKIFDPNNLGVSCGASSVKPLPGWIVSRLPPTDLPDAIQQTGSRKRWWQKIFA